MSVGSAERLLSLLDLFTEDRLEWTPQDMMKVLGFLAQLYTATSRY